jgi:hypothetical protein
MRDIDRIDVDDVPADWGYVVTPDGRVIRASARDGVVLDERGQRLGASVIEDGRSLAAIVRAA